MNECKIARPAKNWVHFGLTRRTELIALIHVLTTLSETKPIFRDYVKFLEEIYQDSISEGSKE